MDLVDLLDRLGRLDGGKCAASLSPNWDQGGKCCAIVVKMTFPLNGVSMRITTSFAADAIAMAKDPVELIVTGVCNAIRSHKKLVYGS